MAPEVVRGDLYDARCDWWSVAVILYEVRDTFRPPTSDLLDLTVTQCLYGHTPFLAEEGGRQQTKQNILVGFHRKWVASFSYMPFDPKFSPFTDHYRHTKLLSRSRISLLSVSDVRT